MRETNFKNMNKSFFCRLSSLILKVFWVFLIMGLQTSIVLGQDFSQDEESDETFTIDRAKSSWWYSGRAKENYENKAYREAIVDFTRAIMLDPEVPEFRPYTMPLMAFVIPVAFIFC